MRVALLALVLLVVCGSVHGWWGWGRRRPRPRPVPTSPPTTNPLVGQACTPRYARRCGSVATVSETTVPANGYGPNVCMKETMTRVQVYSYQYRQDCYNSWRGRRCHLSCSRTTRCDATQNRTKRTVSCCEGFTKRMLHNSLRRDGCPIRLEDTVLDCLDRLNRTMLLEDDSLDSIERRLDDSSIKTTLFAPTETALMNIEADNETIASHLVTGSFRAERLFGQRLTTVANGQFIHITCVNTRGYSTRRLFANGVEITGANACFAKNGVVHEINGVIMPSSRTILQVLDDTPELSSFRELVSKAGLNDFLNKRHLKTVFAPSNSAIDSNTKTCLCKSENRHLLRSFVKFHILSGAEYNSTIRLRTNLHPISCGQYRWYWRRRCSISITIDGRDTSVGGSRIVDADIAASNGVIHTLSRPMNNPNINLSARCPPAPTQPTTTTTPSTEPPSTSAPSTESPSTSAPSTEPPSTSAPSTESPSTSAPSTEPPSTSAPPSTTASSSSPTTVSESPSATRPPDETVSRPTTPPSRPPDEA